MANEVTREYRMIPLRLPRGGEPGHWGGYVPAVDIPPGDWEFERLIQFTPGKVPFVVIRKS